MSNDAALRDILDAVLRIESRLDGHDQRFESIDQRFESIDQRFESIDQRFETIDQRFETIDQRFEEQKEQINTLTEFTVTSLNSLAHKMNNVELVLGDLDHRVLKLELSFEDFRSDTRAYWEHLKGHQEQLDDHEARLSRLEAS